MQRGKNDVVWESQEHLCPIENVWRIIAAAVYASPELQTLTALERPLRKSWRSIYLTTVHNVIGSMPDRLKAVIRDICALS